MMTPTRRRVTGGVDTHADIHVAAALDGRGRLHDTLEISPDRDGFKALLDESPPVPQIR